MLPRSAFFMALRLVSVLLLSSGFALAQSSPPPKRCLAQQGVPDEETKAKQEAGIEDPQIIVDSVEIENPSQIPADIQQLIIAAVRGHELCSTSTCVDELNEVGILGVLQDNGYFRADSTIKVRTISSDSAVEHISLVVHVDLGAQYRKGTLSFRSAEPDDPLVFSEAQLSAFVHLREGDIFDTSKLSQTFKDLLDFYGEHGYIDFTPVPDFDIDDQARIINLALVLDQMQMYRVRRLEFIGDNPAVEQAVRQKIIPGTLLDSRFLGEFDRSTYSMTKNVKYGVVDIQFDFRPCPNATDAPTDTAPGSLPIR